MDPLVVPLVLALLLLALIAVFLLVSQLRRRAALRAVLSAAEAFADRGEQVEIPDIRKAPSDIRAFADVLARLISHADTVHNRDVEVSRMKSDFISTAAHQLRTPLTGIRWALEALAQENITAEQKALVKDAMDKSHDLVATDGTLLDISAIESGKYKYTFILVNLAELCAEIVQSFGPMAKERNLTLSYIPSEQPLPKVIADRERIKWVLNNLVENALQYTPAGGTVRLTTEAAPGRAYVRVHDTGIGIAPEDRGNIFERFYRASNAASKENAGNGLGLYIARTIATDHGGDLNFAANEDGVGTTFTLSLPVAP